MKHLKYIAISTILLCSCSLDESPQDQIPEEAAYATPLLLYQNTVATLYNYLGGHSDGEGLQGTCRGVYDLQTFGSDEAMLPTRGIDWYDGGLWQQMYKHSWNPGNEIVGNSWKYLYKVIALCNNSLEKLQQHVYLAPQDVPDWIAEVRSLRAIYYWYLIDLFGDVPLITSTNVSINAVHTTPPAEVYQFIVDELMANRLQLCNNVSVVPGIYYGRITQSVSNFVLAKLMLNAPVYTGTVNDTCYQKCIEFCNILEDRGYELSADYDDNFVPHNQDSKENIFVIPMDKDLYTNEQHYLVRSLHYRHANLFGFSGENGTCATRHTLKVYGYTSENDYKYDNRFIYNFYFEAQEGCIDRAGGLLTYVPEAVELDLSNSPFIETAGARMRKYSIDPLCNYGGKLIDNDIVLFRFADVLLMRAEAKVRLGLDGYEDMNRVRRRANMEERPCTLETLLDERLLELCWEGWRRQDLIRFGRFHSLYDGPDAVDESDGHTAVYPIPGNVRTLNPNIQQNKGY